MQFLTIFEYYLYTNKLGKIVLKLQKLWKIYQKFQKNLNNYSAEIFIKFGGPDTWHATKRATWMKQRRHTRLRVMKQRRHTRSTPPRVDV